MARVLLRGAARDLGGAHDPGGGGSGGASILAAPALGQEVENLMEVEGGEEPEEILPRNEALEISSRIDIGGAASSMVEEDRGAVDGDGGCCRDGGAEGDGEDQAPRTTTDRDRRPSAVEKEIDKVGDPVEEKQDEQLSFARNLSSPLKTVRNKALESLRDWLCSCNVVEESCLVEIWQSIFYRIWSTAKVSEHGELIGSVARIVGSLKPAVAILAFKVLLSTMILEWNSIEKKKLDKFRLLLQACLAEMFRVLERQSWSEDLIAKFAESFGSLMENHAQAVNLFLVQAFAEELRSRIPPSPEALRVLLEPFVTIFATSTDKAVLQKVRDTVFLQLLQESRKSKDREERCLGSLILDLPLARKFFELSAEPSLGPINKKFLQQLYEEFSKPDAGASPPGVRILKRGASPAKMAAAAAAAAAEELADSTPPPELSVTGRKRKRITGEAVLFQTRRVLRSGGDDPEELEIPARGPRRSPRRSGSRSPSPSPSLRSSPRRRGSGDEQSNHSSSHSQSERETVSGDEDQSCSSGGGGGGKKVRFSLRDNIVWSPQRPLPPSWVRVPPCTAPRGSAMKPGVLPGPIADPEPPKKKRKAKEKKSKEKKSKGKKKKASSSSSASPGGKSKKAKTKTKTKTKKSSKLD